jgi:prepilin-type N-terminal cleavage/methylation domain-containing protein
MAKEAKALNRTNTCSGFTLVEVLLAVVFLALLATAFSTVYSSGFQTLDVQIDRMLLDSELRSRMEVLVGTGFDSLSNDSENVSVNGNSYTITWTVALADLNNDSIPEPSAKTVTVSISGMPERSLTTIMVDHEDRIGKIP